MTKKPEGPEYEDPEYGKAEFVPGRLIVRLVDEVTAEIARGAYEEKTDTQQRTHQNQLLRLPRLDEILAECKCQSVRPVFPRGKFERLSRVNLGQVFVLQFPADADLGAIIKRLEELPEVASVERDPISHVDQMTPDDPRFTNQWHLPQIDMEEAWVISRGDETVIGVYDSQGVDAAHRDLAGNRVQANCAGENQHTRNHGTQVVGVCAAVTDNNRGVAGSGWNARFIGVRASGASANASAITCMVDEGADIIVTSSPVKQDSEPSTLRDAVRYAYQSGVPVVASAGNNNHATQSIPYDQWPAKNSRTVAVGNTTQTDARNTTSNYGPWLDVMAPGTGIWTTHGPWDQVTGPGGIMQWQQITGPNNRYVSVTGTSFSTPLVGGVVALMLSRNRTLGPRQVKELLRQTTNLPAGTNTSNNRYGNGRVNALKALRAARGLWKTVRYGSVPKVGAAAAISRTGWWIVAYSKSTFVGYKNVYWRKMVTYGSVANARPAVAINNNGDWIVNYSKSTFVGYRTMSAHKMVTYPKRNTPGAVDINANGDWIAVYSKSAFVGHKNLSAVKRVTYNSVPGVPGDVAINDRGDWICVYSKSTFVGFKTGAVVKMVTYGSVADAAGRVNINANGDWIVNYSKSTFVGYRTSSGKKMVTYPKRKIHGDVAINNRGDWIAVYSKSTFVGVKTSSGAKMVTYGSVADAPGAVAINSNGNWIVNYSKSTFVGYRTSSGKKMVSYPRRKVGGAVDINANGDWIAVYSLSTFIGHKTAWASKRVYYDKVPKVSGDIAINDQGDWICTYSRTTYTGHSTKSTVQCVRHAPDDMSKADIQDGYSYPSSTLPGSPGAVAMNAGGDWVACHARSASTGTRAVFTNTRRFD